MGYEQGNLLQQRYQFTAVSALTPDAVLAVGGSRLDHACQRYLLLPVTVQSLVFAFIIRWRNKCGMLGVCGAMAAGMMI